MAGNSWRILRIPRRRLKELTRPALPGRHLLTWLDADNDGVVDSGEQKDFSSTSFDDTNEGYLLAADGAEADKIVEFIRGKDQIGYRSREVSNNRTWRLGDVIYSTPTIVTKPAEAFDLIYKDGGRIQTL